MLKILTFENKNSLIQALNSLVTFTCTFNLFLLIYSISVHFRNFPTDPLRRYVLIAPTVTQEKVEAVIVSSTMNFWWVIEHYNLY